MMEGDDDISLPAGCGSCGRGDMDVFAGHLVPVHPVVLLPVLVLPDAETHVLPLPVLQTVVRSIPIRPLRSVQLVVVHPVPGEFARTYF